MHDIISFDMRQECFFGGVKSLPLLKPGHWLFVISLFGGILLDNYVTDELIQICCFMDRACFKMIVVEFIIVCTCRAVMLILAEILGAHGVIRKLKQFEYAIEYWLRGGKHHIKTVYVEPQPFEREIQS